MRPNDSVSITPGSGTTIAAHTVDGKTYPVIIPAGPNGHLTDSAPSYLAWANDVTTDNATNVSHISILNTTTDKIVQLHKLFMVPLQTAAVTGIMLRFDALRITAHSAGTQITPEVLDSTNAALPAGVTVRTKATVTEGAQLFGWALSNDEIGATGAIVAGATILQGLNLMFESPRIQDFTLRQNEGLHIKQVTATSVAALFGYILIFTVKDIDA
jgi:hypothetical protein